MLSIRIASCMRTGAREHNEDDLRHGVADGMAYAVLSDGAGGHDHGAIASDLVVRLMALRLQAAAGVDAAVLHAAVIEAHWPEAIAPDAIGDPTLIARIESARAALLDTLDLVGLIDS